MAARGNRTIGVTRFGVACLATAAVALAILEPAHAAEAPPAPASETTTTEPTPAPPPAPAPPPETTTPAETAPAEQGSTPAPDQPAAPASGDEPDDETSKSADATGSTGGAPATTTPTNTESATTLKDVVKLEDPSTASAPAAPAPAAPAPAAPAPAAPAPAPPSGAPSSVVIVLIQNTPAATAPEPEAAKTDDAKTDDAKAEAAITAAPIVTFRPKPVPAAISLLPGAEAAGHEPRPAGAAPTTRIALTRPQTCARPAARAPLFSRCKQERAVAVAGLRVALTYLPSLPEVRAAIARGAPPRAVVRKVEARPPPKSKAAQERPVAKVRPIVPFGHSGQGMTTDGFSGSPGSASTSRLFAITVAFSLRVPWPSRFARLRLPSTLPHGVIPAPPSARPG